MKLITKKLLYYSVLSTIAFNISCAGNENIPSDPDEPEETPEYFYTGGELGTTTIWESKCFEQPTEAVDNAGLANSFLHGEQIFEGNFVTELNDESFPMRGRGPLAIRSMCIQCHPGYGHGKRLGDYGNDIVGFNPTLPLHQALFQ